MANSLALGCDCKGSIHYLDAHFPSRAGGLRTIKNAICIHEEDAGILFKHTDFRDDSVIVTRARKLVIQQIFTAANYEYAIQWIFHVSIKRQAQLWPGFSHSIQQDGTIQPEIKLTGILNTYAMNPDEDTMGWGTQVYPGVNAHNHQHLFCLRVDANIDGPKNSVYAVDAVASESPVGSPENFYGNAFYAKRTLLKTTGEAVTDYLGETSRTWDIVNEGVRHAYSGKPASYKLVSREVPRLLPKEGSLVWKRAGFARHAVHVTKCISPILPLHHDFLEPDIPYTQTKMISSGQQAATCRKPQALPRSASPSGSVTGLRVSRTRTSCCGTPLVSCTSPPPRISPSCRPSPSRFCFAREISLRITRLWTFRRAMLVRRARSLQMGMGSWMLRIEEVDWRLVGRRGSVVGMGMGSTGMERR
jgi:hypothetical protein